MTFDEFPDDSIGVDGVVALSEMLKVNTTLISLNLRSKDEGKERKRKGKMMVNNEQTMGLEAKE